MADGKRVVRSINMDGERVCVDIFVRPDGSYGFEEYRRDPEDMRGWFSIGRYERHAFETAEGALAEARRRLPWLDGA